VPLRGHQYTRTHLPDIAPLQLTGPPCHLLIGLDDHDTRIDLFEQVGKRVGTARIRHQQETRQESGQQPAHIGAPKRFMHEEALLQICGTQAEGTAHLRQVRHDLEKNMKWKGGRDSRQQACDLPRACPGQIRQTVSPTRTVPDMTVSP